MLTNNDNSDNNFQNSADFDQQTQSKNTNDHKLRDQNPFPVTSQKIVNIPRVNDLESEILSLYSSKIPNFGYSFTGLKRKLGNIHQQSLTNSLDRLVEDSYLVKDQFGNYLLDPDKSSKNLFKSNFKNNSDVSWDERWLGRPLQHVSVKKIYHDLHGKWFGKSRFVGGVYNSQKNEALLEWVNTTNDGQTQLNIKFDEVRARFRNLEWIERDKALEVFNRSFTSNNIMMIFEPSQRYNN